MQEQLLEVEGMVPGHLDVRWLRQISQKPNSVAFQPHRISFCGPLASTRPAQLVECVEAVHATCSQTLEGFAARLMHCKAMDLT